MCITLHLILLCLLWRKEIKSEIVKMAFYSFLSFPEAGRKSPKSINKQKMCFLWSVWLSENSLRMKPGLAVQLLAVTRRVPTSPKQLLFPTNTKNSKTSTQIFHRLLP